MIEFKFHSFKISFHFSFFAIVAVLMLINDFRYTLCGMYACILHELGHLLIMQFFHMEVIQVIFYGAGIKIKMDKGKLYPVSHELIMLLGGCMANFLTFFIFGFQTEYSELRMFGIINLSIGLFNLFPLNHFDGGKILHILIDNFSSSKSVAGNHLSLQIMGIVFVCALVALLMYHGISNFSLFFTLIYFGIAEAFLQNS